MKRTAMKQRARKLSLADFTVDTRLTMEERSQGLDEVTGEPLLPWHQAHHRSSRNMGGSRFNVMKGLASNGLLVNPDTHVRIEANKDNESFDNGWKVHEGHNPEHVPVLLHDGWYLLRADGMREVSPGGGSG